jgi:hypothetical protein
LSDADSFIQEVSEEVRRDRMFRLWKRYAPVAIAVVVAIVGGTAVMTWLDHRDAEAARRAGGLLIDAGAAADPVARADALGRLIETAGGGLAVVARMQAAAALAEAGDRAAAADAFDEAAAQAAAEPALAALAQYRAAVLRAPDVGLTATAAALTPLSFPGNAMRFPALEARGVAHMTAGDGASARADFETILADTDASEATRQRVREYLATLGPASAGSEG